MSSASYSLAPLAVAPTSARRRAIVAAVCPLRSRSGPRSCRRSSAVPKCDCPVACAGMVADAAAAVRSDAERTSRCTSAPREHGLSVAAPSTSSSGDGVAASAVASSASSTASKLSMPTRRAKLAWTHVPFLERSRGVSRHGLRRSSKASVASSFEVSGREVSTDSESESTKRRVHRT